MTCAEALEIFRNFWGYSEEENDLAANHFAGCGFCNADFYDATPVSTWPAGAGVRMPADPADAEGIADAVGHAFDSIFQPGKAKPR